MNEGPGSDVLETMYVAKVASQSTPRWTLNKNEGPDVTIAIDFGVTFTGVGLMFSNGAVHIVNNWPGNLNAGDVKVPSCLVYNHDNTVSSWGFFSDIYDDPLPPGKRENRLFKMFLDPVVCDEAREVGLVASVSPAEAKKHTADYLREIYRHTKRTYEEMTGKTNWAESSVSFLFSIPTTWRGLDVSNTFKSTIRDAGFGTEGPHHSARIDLTEAEAAVVDISKSAVVNFRPGDVFLVTDAGGVTTDFSLVQVTKVDNGIPEMSQISEVNSIGIGSALIDTAFGNLVQQRLDANRDVPTQISAGLAEKMMKSSRFKTVKRLFGDDGDISRVYRIAMPDVSCDFSHAGLRAEGGRMLFDKHEIQGLFDPHVESIVAKIQEQLDWMVQNRRSEQVKYMVLSGGMSSSAGNPQTTVVRGLLADYKRRIDTGDMPVLANYIARASYGVVVREPYSSDRHVGEQLEHDQFDPDETWAVNQIEWIIRKGDTINPTAPLTKQFIRRLSPGQTASSFSTQIVSSKNEIGFLPRSLLKGGVNQLCRVESNLTDLKLDELVLMRKRGGFFRPGYEYYKCIFDVHVIVAPADLRFELWFNRVKFSRGHEPIKVEWNSS
ncbi:hypothetical protein CEP51_011497 [Fusarium floridanum]|uniref:Uncharacterized protein n=1 Tax=Fusarium floridanum TaxID=1325733 RepID=A0A428RAY0_9HYPO|nr:hypothetical protein CEP51_011497 [Fusarium floridanum]